MSEPTQENLLGNLNALVEDYKKEIGWNHVWEELITQLKQIVKEQFEEISCLFCDGVYIRDGNKFKIIEHPEQQKPTVTREWLWGKIGEFPLTSGMELPDIMTAREKYLVKLLDEAGVKVEN